MSSGRAAADDVTIWVSESELAKKTASGPVSQSVLMRKAFPHYNRRERVADRTVHTIGIVLAVFAFVKIVVVAQQQEAVLPRLGLMTYGFGFLAMLGSSALYNLARPSPRKEILRRIDHAAIYVMIAATYTPLALNIARPETGIALLLTVWVVAAAGAAAKLAFPRRWERAATGVYLLLGWCFLAVCDELFASLSLSAFILLLVGGLFYTAGVAVHIFCAYLRYHNVVWHALVLLAAGCHYFAILGIYER
jgi:hemolysin III